MSLYSIDSPSLWTEQMKEVLKKSLFVTPTDTVYGLGCVISHPTGSDDLQTLKQTNNHQHLMLVNSLASAAEMCEISAEQEAILERYWPGPITFILNAKNKKGTQAVRCPQDPFINKWLEFLGEPIYSTSCNPHGKRPAQSVKEAQSYFKDSIAIYVDGQERLSAPASTLVDLTQKSPTILRQGTRIFTMTF